MLYGHNLARALADRERTQADEHQRVEAEVARRTEELQAAHDELARLAQVKDEFLSVVSHELRTPINYVQGFAGLLATAPLSAEHAQYLDGITTASRRMLDLVDNLLDSAALQAGQLRLHPEPTEYRALVAEVVHSIGPLARDKRIAVACDLQAEGTYVLDRQRVIQVLTNLMANAVKFTGRDGQVVVRAFEAGGSLVTEVRDTGMGIAAEDLPRLFQRFTQLDMGIARKVGGSGLGLSICKALVEAHGGQIGVESAPGMGSTFRFTLPIVAAATSSDPKGLPWGA
jgi:signal transduction histidine kinase